MIFLERLNELIKEKGITKKQFLEDCGFWKNSFDNWKKSKGGMPTLPFCRIIAEYFGVSVEYVMCETDDRSEKESPAVTGEAESFMKAYDLLSPDRQARLRDALADLVKEQLQGG